MAPSLMVLLGVAELEGVAGLEGVPLGVRLLVRLAVWLREKGVWVGVKEGSAPAGSEPVALAVMEAVIDTEAVTEIEAVALREGDWFSPTQLHRPKKALSVESTAS